MIDLQNQVELSLNAARIEVVRADLPVGHLVPGMPLAYSTNCMITVMEILSDEAVAAQLPAGWMSVGARVDAQHLKATPVDFEVTTRAQVVAVGEREICSRVTACDNVERERFLRSTEEKAHGRGAV